MAQASLSKAARPSRENRWRYIRRRLIHSWQLYVLLLPALIWVILFCYQPMYGVIIAFKKYSAKLGITGSPWVGMKYFQQYFGSSIAGTTILNTVIISVLQILVFFPMPILFAVFLNQIRNVRYKKTLQTISFAPHFVSNVVVVSILSVILSPSGFVNRILQGLGSDPLLFMSKAEYFRGVYIISEIWQHMGFDAIIYLAALTAISPELYEAAMVDGASRMSRIIHIDFPSIFPTIVLMLIMRIGQVMSLGYEKVYLMQAGTNTSVSEIISTWVYKSGLQKGQFSYATAVGLFNSVVNLALLLAANKVSRKLSNTSMF